MFFLELFNAFIRIFVNIVGEIFDRCSFQEGFNTSEGEVDKKKPALGRAGGRVATYEAALLCVLQRVASICNWLPFKIKPVTPYSYKVAALLLVRL